MGACASCGGIMSMGNKMHLAVEEKSLKPYSPGWMRYSVMTVSVWELKRCSISQMVKHLS